MGSNYKVTYGVDLVFCIDVTMSMAHILDTVKQNALRFYEDFQNIMEKKHKMHPYDQLILRSCLKRMCL